jgi:hypothetical protein
MTEEEPKLPVLDMQVANRSIDTIKDGLDKGCKEGVYSLEEVKELLVSLANLAKTIEVLDAHQKFQLKNKK